MLVLSRHVGESIDIGPDIRVIICGYERGKIRIGIEAPRELRVLRTELLDAPKQPPAAEPV